MEVSRFGGVEIVLIITCRFKLKLELMNTIKDPPSFDIGYGLLEPINWYNPSSATSSLVEVTTTATWSKRMELRKLGSADVSALVTQWRGDPLFRFEGLGRGRGPTN